MNPLRACALVTIGWTLSLAPLSAAEQAPKSEVTAESVVRDLKYRDVKSPYLLAHSVQVEAYDQPHAVPLDHALLAIEFATNNWRLVHVILWDLGNDLPRWQRPPVFDAFHYRDHRDFTQRPTKAEVEQFLVDTWWDFDADEHRGFRLLRGEVYADTWQKALGYKPEHQYPKTKP